MLKGNLDIIVYLPPFRSRSSVMVVKNNQLKFSIFTVGSYCLMLLQAWYGRNVEEGSGKAAEVDDQISNHWQGPERYEV